MRKHTIAMLLCMTAFLGALAGCHKTCSSNMDTKSAEVKHAMLQNIARLIQTHDTETVQRVTLITEKLALALPNTTGLEMREGASAKNAIFFVPLFADASYPDTWQDILQADTGYMDFVPSLRAVIMKIQHAYSPAGSVIAFLHHAFHADVFSQSGQEEQTDLDYFAEEVEAYAFQGKIMEAIGGEKYRMILQKELSRIKKNVQKQEIIPWPQERDIDVAFVFGNTTSPEETKFLQKGVWIHATFMLFDQAYPPESAWKKKTLFLSYLADNGWQL